MSQTSNKSTENDDTPIKAEADESREQTDAETDLTDFLEERSELAVQYEYVEGSDGSTVWRPVARTADGEKADVADFPSGKYADDKSANRGKFSKRTYQGYRRVIDDFIKSQGVDDFSEVTPREIGDWLRDSRHLARTTRDGRLERLEVFVKWLENEWRLPTEGRRTLSQAVQNKRDSLGVAGDEFSRARDDDHKISQERAKRILEELAEYEYPSRVFVEYLLILHVGFRQSGLRSINCDDVKPQQGIIKVRNRPSETGLRLKRGNKGERDVNVTEPVMRAVQDYIEHGRKSPSDGTDALLTSAYGRINKTTLYRDIASATACGECTYADVLDDDKLRKYKKDGDKPDPDDELSKRDKYRCSDAIGAHDLRRVAVSRMANEGVSWDTIGERANAQPSTLKEYYDARTHSEKAERRREEILRSL